MADEILDITENITSDINNLLEMATEVNSLYQIGYDFYNVPIHINRGDDISSSTPYVIADFLGEAYNKSGTVKKLVGYIWDRINNGVKQDVWKNNYLLYKFTTVDSSGWNLQYLYNQLNTLQEGYEPC